MESGAAGRGWSPVAGRGHGRTASPAGVAPPASYGRHRGRASAPAAADIDRLSHHYEVGMPSTYRLGQEPTVEMEWAGDVAVVVVDGRVWPTDSWTGSRWELDAVDLGLESGFEIWIVPCVSMLPSGFPSRAATTGWVPNRSRAVGFRAGPLLWHLEGAALSPLAILAVAAVPTTTSKRSRCTTAPSPGAGNTRGVPPISASTSTTRPCSTPNAWTS